MIINWNVELKPFARADGSVWSAIGDFLFGGGDGGPQGPVEVLTGTTSTTIPDSTGQPSPSSPDTVSPTSDEGPSTGTTSTTVPPADGAGE